MKLSDNRRVFSDSALARLDVPAQGHAHHYDAQCPGLAVRITAAGTKSYKAFNRAGTPQFLHIAEVGEISLDDARLRAQAILRSMRETGLTPKAQHAVAEQERQKERRLDVTLGAALDLYLATRLKPGRKRTIKQASADNMRREVTKYLKDCLELPLRSLTYAALNRQHDAIIDRFAPSVADRVVGYVGTLIRFIEEREEVHLFGRNPASKVLKLDGHDLVPRETHLPAKRFPDFFEAVAAMEADARDFHLISLFTGLRVDSVRTLRWDLIDLDEKIVVLTVAKGRRDKQERLPLSDFVVGILRERSARAGECPFVFAHPKDPMTHLCYHDTYMDHLWASGGGTMERLCYHARDREGQLRYGKRGNPVMGRKIVLSGHSKVCNQHGLPLIHHDYRRTFCSVAAGEAGVDVFTAMRLSLHKYGGGASNVHSEYVQLEHLRPGLDRIAAAILRLGERQERHVKTRLNNVVAFVPRRSASQKQPHEIGASPLIVA